MQIRSGPAAIVDSGVVTTFAGHGLDLVLDVGEDHLRIELRFASTADGEPAVASVETADGYRLDCANFDDASPRGSAEPVLLGEIGSDLWFFHFRAARHGRSADRTVWWTLYRAAKVDVGWRAR
jgi:hypothetical protein